jgi:Set1/Ash2 histone methyltransferase complex subunit ASH2
MGTKFHQAIGKSYCKGGYGLGDVLGFLIMMPDTNPKAPLIPPSYKDRPLVRFKSHLYYEDKDDKSQEAVTTPRPQSQIICFKNGECQGVAFENILEGTYHPAVSLYKGCTVTCNFGPDFWAEPSTEEFPHRGMFERAEEAIVEQTTSDLHFLTDNHGKLRLENAVILPQ